ncbi:uncharacterized protein V1518DRAFT_8378 [Limtongia smithiae]|uniref:uncharacterized protein n=1 Tax=Limtongia smithiae TaxID=1125753 RepID=UPI0034CFBA77
MKWGSFAKQPQPAPSPQSRRQFQSDRSQANALGLSPQQGAAAYEPFRAPRPPPSTGSSTPALVPSPSMPAAMSAAAALGPALAQSPSSGNIVDVGRETPLVLSSTRSEGVSSSAVSIRSLASVASTDSSTSTATTAVPGTSLSSSHRSTHPLRLFNKYRREQTTDYREQATPLIAGTSPSIAPVPPSPRTTGPDESSLLQPSDSIATTIVSPPIRSPLRKNFDGDGARHSESTHRPSFSSVTQSTIIEPVDSSSPSLTHIKRFGWLNFAEAYARHNTPSNRQLLRLKRAVLKENKLYLYKPPAECLGTTVEHIDALQSRGLADSPFADLSHLSTSRHPELIVDEDGTVVSGTLEAICHEVIYGDDVEFSKDVILILPALMDIYLVFDMLTKLAAISEECSDRVIVILTLVHERLSSLLLDGALYASVQILLEYVVPEKREVLKLAIIDRRALLLGLLRFYPVAQPNLPKSSIENMFQTYRTGISAASFLHMDLQVFASQVHLFDLKIFRFWNPVYDFSLLYGVKYGFSRKNPLVSTSMHPHFLGTLLVNHLFKPALGAAGTITTFRANILARWIALGNILKQRGDMVSWLAIASTICSPAISRLEDTWALVSNELIELIGRDWADVIIDLDRRSIRSEGLSHRESSHIFAPVGIGRTYRKECVVPFFGDVGVHYFAKMAEVNKDAIWIPASRDELSSIQNSLNRWTTYLSTIQNAETAPKLESAIPALQECIYRLYDSHMNAPPLTPQALMEMSLECEPPTSGVYHQQYIMQKPTLSTGSYPSILFTEVLPSYKLFAQRDLMEVGGLLYNKKTSSLKTSSTSDSLADPRRSPSVQKAVNGARPLRRVNSFPVSRTGPQINVTGYPDLDSASRSRFIAFGSPDSNFIFRSGRDVLNLGVDLYHVRREMVLKSFKGDNDDGGGSRLSSVIENPPASNNSRRLSAQLLPADAQFEDDFDSAIPMPSPITVVPKAAVFDRLVDILVLGTEDFTEIVNADDLLKVGPSVLHMDMDAYTAAFLSSYRNFSSPYILLDALRRRFIGAKSAAISLSSPNKESEKIFPIWNQVLDDSDDRSIDWVSLAKIHIGVLEACNLWMADYYSDLLSGAHLRDAFLDFLLLIDQESLKWKERGKDYEDLKVFADSFEMLTRKLRKTFAKKSYRPVDASPWPYVPTPTSSPLKFPESNIGSIEKFCNAVDRVISILFRQITLKDWITVQEMFAMQTLDPLKMYSTASASTAEDEVIIQDVFTYCASLRSFNSDELMIAKFPKPVKKLFAFRMNFVHWLVSQLLDRAIKRPQRIKRMVTLLTIIAHCRQRMSVIGYHLKDGDFSEETLIPSMIETAVAAAIVRPESRYYKICWVMAARELGKDVNRVDTLESIIPTLPTDEKSQMHSSTVGSGIESSTPKTLTPCMGWIFERIFEIICFFPNMSLDNPAMVNFDKPRYIYNFLSNIVDIELSQHRDESVGQEVAASLLTSELATLNFDRRQLKETAAKEGKESAFKINKIGKPFQILVQQEIEKIRRDSRQVEILERMVREQTRVVQTRKAATVQTQKNKSRFGDLFRSMRPISMALAMTPGVSHGPTGRTVSLSDLPEAANFDMRTVKPVWTINLANAQVTIPTDGHVPSMFVVSGEDGMEFRFQATCAEDMKEWIRALQAAVPGMSEKIAKPESIMIVDEYAATRVFGVPVSDVCRREKRLIPMVVMVMLDWIESRGLEEIGIYRVPGSLVAMRALKQEFDSGATVDMSDERWSDINIVAGCLKLYFREMPEPILTEALFPEFTKISKISEEKEQIKEFADMVKRLPMYNYFLLKRLIDHLAVVSKYGDVNKMHAVNLAIVFSMCMLPSTNTVSMSSEFGLIQAMLRTMISFPDLIFVKSSGGATKDSDDSAIVVDTETKRASLVTDSARSEKVAMIPEEPADISPFEPATPPVAVPVAVPAASSSSPGPAAVSAAASSPTSTTTAATTETTSETSMSSAETSKRESFTDVKVF